MNRDIPREYFRSPTLLRQEDWFTVIQALLHYKDTNSQRLAKRLLADTKHGRQVQILRFIHREKPRLQEIQNHFHCSRRTLFRDLANLQKHGAELVLDQQFHYRLKRVPPLLKRFL